MVRLQMFREFGGKTYVLRVQPSTKMHHGFVNPTTFRYKHEVDRIANTRRERGEDIRVVKVADGWRLYFRGGL
jgi:hypothetical protein